MTDKRTCDVRATLAALAIRSYTMIYCTEIDFRKIPNFGTLVTFIM